MAKKQKHPLPGAIPGDLGSLAYLLEKGGPLDASWGGFEPREAQLAMFMETLRAFRDGGQAVIEAGTGTGKTLAYLLPALISGKKTFVSTGLKNLQEQILAKDLRFIREHFSKPFRAVVMKGRRNYACMRMVYSMKSRTDRMLIPQLRERGKLFWRWAQESETGELDELGRLDFIYSPEPPFDRLASTTESCLGRSCVSYEDCFVSRVRRLAAEADIVLLNHHLFMADLAIRRRGQAFLPEWEAAVFDEAHLLLDIAADYFSYKATTRELLNAGKFLEQALDWELGQAKEYGPDYRRALEALKKSAESIEGYTLLISNKYQNITEEAFLWPRVPEGAWSAADSDFKRLLKSLRDELEKILEALEVYRDRNDDFRSVIADLEPQLEALDFITKKPDDSYVYQVKSDSASVELAAVPIDVAPWLAATLFSRDETIVLCSATISAKGSLDYFREKTGVPDSASSLILGSPFNYADNTIFYVPMNMSEPSAEALRQPTYDEEVVGQIKSLLAISEGRALVLFTSFRQMYMVRDALLELGQGFRLLWQEPGKGKAQLLEDFRRDFHSVLLATQSFWQGVDIQGQSLSAVIIDKIPFPRPNSPLVKAKSALIESKNGNPFYDFFLPEATLSLKQGLGRLIRAAGDWGLLALLDSRMHHKGYGRKVFKDLGYPTKILTCRFADVEKFFSAKNASAP